MITGNELITITIEDPTMNVRSSTRYGMNSAMMYKNGAREFHMENLDFLLKMFDNEMSKKLKNEK